MLPLAAALVVLIPTPTWAIEEFYSRHLYPWVQNGVTFLSNLLPVALIDLFILAAVALVVLRVVRLAGRAKREGLPAAAWESAQRLLRAAAVLLLLFMSIWGCHYRRSPLEAALEDVDQPTTALLVSVIGKANGLAASLRPGVQGQPQMSYDETSRRLVAPMAAALRDLDLEPLARAGRPKHSFILTPFFTWAGVNGMINPLALESIVHPGLLPVERPFVLAHEWAHLAGLADESEASAVGWLACMRGEPALAYSASIYLIMEAAAALPGEAWRQASAKLDEGVRADIRTILERMRQQQKPQVQRAAFRVYDGYLKANRVEDGTASYGRALSLILSPKLRGALEGYGGVTRKPDPSGSGG